MNSTLTVLRNPSLRRAFFARAISVLGDGIAPIAVSFGILGTRGGSATDIGLVLTARFVAQVVCMIPGGVLADRMPRARVMALTGMVAGLAQGATAVLFIAHAARLEYLVVLAAVAGAMAGASSSASRALVADQAEEGQLQSANAVLTLSTSVATIGGYATGAALVSLLGPGWALTIDASSFLLSAGLLVGLPRGRVTAPDSRAPALFAQVRAGWIEFASRPWVWAMSAQAACINISISGVMVLGPLVAATTLGGARGWGTVLACQAAGAAIGSLLATQVCPRRPLRAAVLVSAGFVPMLVALAWSAPLMAVMAAAALSGAAVSMYEVFTGTTLQQHIPPAALAQVMACDEFGSLVIVPASFAVAGPLAAAIGVTAVLAGAGLLVAAGGIFAVLVPSVRTLRVPERSSDATRNPGPVALNADGRS
jgi:MFS family permease